MHIIPNSIHLIWLGSFLSEEHQQRISTWRDLNPGYSIYLWISKTKISQNEYDIFNAFCTERNLILSDVDHINTISPEVNQWLKARLKRPFPNYGALSDIYRFYILQRGGWYFDCDVTPIKALPLNMETLYGFALNANLVPGGGVAVTPDQLAVAPWTQFISMSIKIIESMIKAGHGQDLDQYVQAEEPRECWMGTENTTGLIAYGATHKLLFKSNQRLLSLSSTDFIEPNIQLSHVLGDGYFETIKRELSWLKSRYPHRGSLRLESDEAYCLTIQKWFVSQIKAILPINIEDFTMFEPIPVSLFMFRSRLNELSSKIESTNQPSSCSIM